MLLVGLYQLKNVDSEVSDEQLKLKNQKKHQFLNRKTNLNGPTNLCPLIPLFLDCNKIFLDISQY